MKGRNPTKDEREFMHSICEIGCIVCLNNGTYTPHVTPHHMEGKTKLGAHYKVIPLCGKHHQIGDPEKRWVSRHADGKASFEKEYGTELDLYHQCLDILDKDNES